MEGTPACIFKFSSEIAYVTTLIKTKAVIRTARRAFCVTYGVSYFVADTRRRHVSLMRKLIHITQPGRPKYNNKLIMLIMTIIALLLLLLILEEEKFRHPP